MSGSVIAPITSSPCCGFGSKFAAQNKNGSGKYREVTTAKLVDIGIGIGVWRLARNSLRRIPFCKAKGHRHWSVSWTQASNLGASRCWWNSPWCAAIDWQIPVVPCHLGTWTWWCPVMACSTRLIQSGENFPALKHQISSANIGHKNLCSLRP